MIIESPDQTLLMILLFGGMAVALSGIFIGRFFENYIVHVMFGLMIIGFCIMLIGVSVQYQSNDEFKIEYKELTMDMTCEELKHTYFNSQHSALKEHVKDLYFWDCKQEIELDQ